MPSFIIRKHNCMISNNNLVIAAVFVPFFGSFLLPFIGGVCERARNLASFLFVLTSFICGLALIPHIFAGETVSISIAGIPFLMADRLALFMSLVSSGVGAIIVLYSTGYIREYDCRNEYYFMVVLFLAAMMGLVFSRHLLALYVFWEVTAITCWRLIGFFRERPFVVKADKAFLVTVFGALMMLVGFLMVYAETGSFDMLAIREAEIAKPLSNIAALFILFGIFSKSATLPLHTWLPDAGVAPSPVTALLHAAVLVKIGVYVFARLFVATFTVDPAWHTIVAVVAAASALVSAGAAMLDRDLKRIIAFSTISQIGFIFLGLAVGNELGVAGALLYILMHGIAKGGLFLCAGIVEHGTHMKDITKLGGLVRAMPVTAISFALCAFSVMGLPPLGGFFGKFMVIAGAATSGHTIIAGVFIAGAVMTIIYMFRVFTMVFLGECRLGITPSHEGTPVMVTSVAILAFLALVGGLLIQYPSIMAEAAAGSMLGGMR